MTIEFTPKLGFYKGALGDGPYATQHNTAADNLEERLAGTYAGDPNGHVRGWYLGQEVMDTANGKKYYCTVIGEAVDAVWIPYPRLGQNHWTDVQLFDSQYTLFFWNNADGGLEGPILDLNRHIAAPSNGNTGAGIRFRQSVSNGTAPPIYEVISHVTDVNVLSLASRIIHRTRWAGGFVDPIVIGPGLLVGGATPGGMPTEPGIINAAGIMIDGVPVTLPQCAHYEARGALGADGPVPDGATWQPYPFNFEGSDSADFIFKIGDTPYFQVSDGLYVVNWAVTFYNGIESFGTRFQRGDGVTIARGTNGSAPSGQVGVSCGNCTVRVTGGFAVLGVEYRAKTVGASGRLGKALTEEPECYGAVSFTQVGTA